MEYADQYDREEYNNMFARAPEHARSMDKARSEARACIMQTSLRQLTLRTCVVWKSSRENRVKLEVFQDPSFDYVSGEWTGFDVDVGGIFPVFAHYFRTSIDTTHRKQSIKTRHIAMLHSKSMTAQSPRVASTNHETTMAPHPDHDGNGRGAYHLHAHPPITS